MHGLLKIGSCWQVDGHDMYCAYASGVTVGAAATHQECPRRLEGQASHLCPLVESDADIALNLAILDVQHIPACCRTRAVQHNMAAAQLGHEATTLTV